MNALSQGDIYYRVIQAIQNNCTVLQIHNMIRNSVIERAPDSKKYMRNVTYDHLDDIIEETGVSAPYILFGTEEKVIPEYTPYDGDIIQMIDQLSVARLQFLIENFIRPLYDITWMDTISKEPALRLAAYIRKLSPPPFRTPADLFTTENKHFAFDDVEERYWQFLKRSRNVYLFPTDYLPDVATLAGISLHWLLGLKRNPLFCSTNLGDTVFDYYTLMPKRYQIMLRNMLGYMVDDYSLILKWQKEDKNP